MILDSCSYAIENLNCIALLLKFSFVPEGADEAGAFTADAAQGHGRPSRRVARDCGRTDWQLVLFPVPPVVFHRVEFRGISWKTFHPDFTLQNF